tara:strand:+ start:170 stop:385 length:216 start_codon:yes stop_codon:yes gene_type:complete
MVMGTTTSSSQQRRCPPWLRQVLGRERFDNWRQLPGDDRKTVRRAIRREAIETYNTEMDAVSNYGGFIYGS